jgi:3-deoxy-D-manno-octulosonic acid kinase
MQRCFGGEVNGKLDIKRLATKPMAINHQQVNKHHILYQDGLSTKTKTAILDLSLFDANKLTEAGKILKTAKGRGTTYFIAHDSQELVLRHYWRGGLIGKFLSDTYLWQSLQTSRPFQEFSLLEYIQSKNLPAPKPIAAKISRTGLFYRADIITQAIPNSTSLVNKLQYSLDAKSWQSIGQTIRLFHDHDIYHDDLNANNVLFSEKNIFIIDFDKGKIIINNSNWKQANLERLKRSLIKEKSLNNLTAFSDSDWQDLITGYNKNA